MISCSVCNIGIAEVGLYFSVVYLLIGVIYTLHGNYINKLFGMPIVDYDRAKTMVLLLLGNAIGWLVLTVLLWL